MGYIYSAHDLLFNVPWWGWPILLFCISFFVGTLAVPSGIGGAVIFVPIVGALFPFSMDFVRGTGILLTLTGALSAGPRLLRDGLANIRLAIPLALIGSSFSIIGAIIGFNLPENMLRVLLGVTIFVIVGVMGFTKKSVHPVVTEPDSLSKYLGIFGKYYDGSIKKEIPWQVHRTHIVVPLFVFVGFISGMLGVGGGWAATPLLNIVMGAPIKIALSTTSFVISITSTSTAWVYFNKGAVLPIIVAPSIIGMMLGTKYGVIILKSIKPETTRYFVMVLLAVTGLQMLLKGLGL